MSIQDFFDFMKSINLTNLQKLVILDGEKFSRLKIYEFRHEKGLFSFLFIYNFSNEWTYLFRKRIKKQGNTKPVFGNPPLLHHNQVKIRAPKVTDMVKLMQFVPQVNQQYFQNVIKSHSSITEA